MLTLNACPRRGDLDGDMGRDDGVQRFDGSMAVPGAVAADHALASEAGARLLREGGNAVDAAIAAALASGVVQPSGSGLGGGGFALVVPPQGEPVVLDFREVAPAAATMEAFASGASSTRGGMAVAVPAEGLGLAELHRAYGRAPIGAVAAPAVTLADAGFPTGDHLEKSLLEAPDMRAIFLTGNRRPGLAEALREWAVTSGEAFRTGWVAEDFVQTTRAQGGVLALEDLTAYQVKRRSPIRVPYGGRTVLTMPPPSFGGVALAEMLAAVPADASLHCRVEAAKHAMAERAAFGGDPDFAPVQVDRLLSPDHATEIREDCGPATFPPAHYAPAVAPPDDHGTLHISAMDAEGWAVALTTTINTAFGSHLVAGRSGIVLNNEMDDFTTRRGVANEFGLVQSENNVVQPGKRPLSSMTPTVVLGPDGRPEVAVGGSGGPFIITATYQVLRGLLDDGKSPLEAVSEARWHHQWQPDAVLAEAGVATDELLSRGHRVETVTRPFCAVQVVARRDGSFFAASDPRKGGAPAFSPRR